jgi:hypothetical protein
MIQAQVVVDVWPWTIRVGGLLMWSLRGFEVVLSRLGVPGVDLDGVALFLAERIVRIGMKVCLTGEVREGSRG